MRQPSLSKQVGIFLAFCAAMAIVSPAQTFTTLVVFDETNGAYPYSSLIQGTDGNFYGTTYQAGLSNNCYDYYGCSTAFRMTPGGALTTLYSFCSEPNCADGSNPAAGLVQGTDGNFYGTSFRGGANGYGTVFKITSEGTLTTLHIFDGRDGGNPVAGLVQGTDGNFYGTTSDGGANDNCSTGCGTVFKITPEGTLTTLHNFDGSDGATPLGTLVQASGGNFYGTTQYGGANNNCYQGCGTVFKMTPEGGLTTLYSFCPQTGCPDGFAPLAGLVQATDGNFYGTTGSGGANGYGTVFKITPGGTLTTLHSFDGADGNGPAAGLVQATNRVFYGTTVGGGTGGCGTLGCGTVFSLSVTPSILSFLPRIGRVGTSVVITGENFTGATSVTFGSVQAREFTVESTTEIKATVPEGARTGKIGVTTPGGTATSERTFTII